MRNYWGGFTIVESMIFLTISAAMFAGVITLFQDSQSSTQFSQSVREFESDINGILNDTQAGVFPPVNDVSCRYIGASATPTYTTDTGAKPGDNNGCIMVGKVIQLGDGTNREAYLTHSIVGKSGTDAAIQPADSFIHPFRSTSNPVFDTTESSETSWGLEIKHAFYNNGGVIRYVWGVGVLYRQYGQGASGGGFRSGLANYSLYAVTPDSNNALSIANAYIDKATFQNVVPSKPSRDFIADLKVPIVICLVGGNGDQAVIEVGSSDGGLNAVARFETLPECNP